uniref:Liver-expressed antimicrobial peptide 2 n=1 Tax=Cyprinus carpio TaxID=7962 RepID=A0A8C1RZ73_CYPCA
METRNHSIWQFFCLFVAYLKLNLVQAAPIDTEWATGLIHRAKRSLLWRWNTLKPVGSGCRDHYECGTNYCRGPCILHSYFFFFFFFLIYNIKSRKL